MNSTLVVGFFTLAASLGGVWLNDYLAKQRKSASEEAAKRLLTTMLNRKWKWNRIDTLANVVGTDEATVRRLLLEIGARGSMKDGRLWGLLTRNPIGEEIINRIGLSPN